MIMNKLRGLLVGLLLLLTQTGIVLADSDERFSGIKAGFELTNASGIPVTEQVLLGHHAIIQRN